VSTTVSTSLKTKEQNDKLRQDCKENIEPQFVSKEDRSKKLPNPVPCVKVEEPDTDANKESSNRKDNKKKSKWGALSNKIAPNKPSERSPLQSSQLLNGMESD